MTTHTLSEVRKTWQRRKQIGNSRAVREIGSLLNQRGIEAAGDRSLPFYWVIGFFVVPIGMMGVSWLFSFAGPIGDLIGGALVVLSTLILLLAWPLTAVIVYWDCRAAEKYAGFRFTLGKVIAIASVVLGPAGAVFHLVYRIWKFD